MPMKMFLVLFSSLFLLASCVEFKNPICDSSNFIEVPDLEGNYSMMMEGVKINLSFKKEGETAYEISMWGEGEIPDDPQIMNSCLINGNTYLSSAAPDTEGHFSFVLLTKNQDQVALNLLAADEDYLSENNIPFKSITSEMGDYVVIDNRNFDSATIIPGLVSAMALEFQRN